MRRFRPPPVSSLAEGSALDIWRLVILSLLAALAGLATPLLTMLIFDSVIPQGRANLMTQIAVALAAFALVRAALELVARRAVLRTEMRAAARFGARAWSNLVNLPIPVLRKQGTVATGLRLIEAAEAIPRLAGDTILLFLAVPVALANLALMASIHAELAAAGLVLSLAAAIATGILRTRRWNRRRNAGGEDGKTLGRVHEWLRGLGRIRLAGAEAEVLATWQKNRPRVRPLRGDTSTRAVFAGYMAFSCAVLFAFSSRTELEIGQFLAIFAAFGGLAASVRTIAEAWPPTRGAIHALRQADSLVAGGEAASMLPSEPTVAEVDLNDVHFTYDGAASAILDGFSMHIRPGEFVALAGASGSGKSTVLRLLLGFEKPDRGAVRVGGIDASLQHGLPAGIGVVLQHPLMFPGDLFRNIAGESELTLDDAWQAAGLAGLADEIRALPMGMHTVMDASGTNFSFGQRQRIALARALARRPKILLLDEATSALDVRAQRRVMTSLASLGSTRFVIAHRLSVLRSADRVLFLEGGRIVEEGTCESLLSRNGRFADLMQRRGC